MTDSPAAVVTECDLPQAPDKVWRALTVPSLLAAWLPDAVNSEILAAEPNRLLRYRWTGKEEDRDDAGRTLESVVTFELTGTEAGGTHLRVVHRLVPAVAFAGADASSNILAFKRRWKEPFVMGNTPAQGSGSLRALSALASGTSGEAALRLAA
jgi:uncharacterized protein YndB with AHSA1/START domain